MKANLFYATGIALGLGSVACGDAIAASASWGGMLGYFALSLGLLAGSILCMALGCNADQQRAQARRLKRLPRRTSSSRARHARKGA